VQFVPLYGATLTATSYHTNISTIPILGESTTLAPFTVSLFQYKAVGAAGESPLALLPDYRRFSDINCPLALNLPITNHLDQLCNVTIPKGMLAVGFKFGLKGPGNGTAFNVTVGGATPTTTPAAAIITTVVPGHFATIWFGNTDNDTSADADASHADTASWPFGGGSSASGTQRSTSERMQGESHPFRSSDSGDGAATVIVGLRPTEPLPTTFPTWVTFASLIVQPREPTVTFEPV
jgi:hypothetical protein